MRPSLLSGAGRAWRVLDLGIDGGSQRPGPADGQEGSLCRGPRPARSLGGALGLLAALAILASAPAAQAQAQARAQAQGAPASAPALREVERGFWIGSRVGGIVYFDLPGEGAATSYGSLMGIEAGVDLGRSLQLGLVAWGQSIGAPADYLGITDDSLDPKRARGDFQSLMAGAMLRVAFLRLADDNGIERTFFFGRLAGGATLNRPVGILDEQGYFASAGLGVEYFTRLRHFSVGLEIDGISLIGDSGTALGAAILPHVKYTF